MLFDTLLHSYLDAPHVPSRPSDEAPYLVWWMAQLGGQAVATLAHDHIRAALQTLIETGRSPGAARHYLRALRRACEWAMREGHLSHNPCVSSVIPKDQRATIRALSVEEERALCEALGQPYATWVRLAILTGLTQSEQFRLRWVDIQFDRAVLTVLSGTTGTPTEIALCSEAVELLRGLRAQTDSRWVFPDPKSPSRPVDTHQFYTREWPRAIQRAGIPRCAWKDLRHTCGRRLAEAGWTTEAITGFLRHWSKRRVLVYGAWNPDRAAATKSPSRAAVRPEISASLRALQEALRQERGNAPLTFRDLAHFYTVHQLKDRPARETFDRMYQQFWTGWADRPCTAITKREVTAWYLGLSQTPGHANKALTFLRALYNWAMRIGLLEEIYNPAVRIDRYFRPSRERYLSEAELITLKAALPSLSPKYQAYFLTLLYTGARLSEARCMRWTDLEAVSADESGPPTYLFKKPRTKNGHSHTVPLPRQVVDAIQRLPRDQDYVFPGAQGHPLSRAAITGMWQTLRRRLGLDGVTVHDIRRTVASHLSQRGANMQTVQNVLGHRGLQHLAVYSRLDTRSVASSLQCQADWLSRLGEPPEAGADSSGPRVPGPRPPAPVLSDRSYITWSPGGITPDMVGTPDEWPGM